MRASLLVAFVLLPSPTRAQPREGVSLAYAVGPGVTRCPDARALRESIAARLGRDPFARPTTDRQSRLSITVLRIGRGLRALISWDHGDDSPPSIREVASPTDDCADIVATAALTVSLALDAPRPPAPTATPAPSPAPAPSAPPIVVSSPRVLASRPAAVPETPRSRFWAFLGPVAGAGFSPGGDLGLAVDLGVSASHFALSLGARADLPVTTTHSSTGGSVHTQRAQAELALCWHTSVSRDSLNLYACALATGGALFGQGSGVDQPRQDTTWIASAGARAMADFRLSRRFGLRLRLDALAPVRRSVVKLDQEVVWAGAWLQGSVALGVVVHFG